MATDLTLECLLPTGWRPTARLIFDGPERGAADGGWRLEYDAEYVLDRVAEVGSGERGLWAVASLYPVDFTLYGRGRRWPALLDDIRPAGSARRWWVDRLNLRDRTEAAQDHLLLARAAIAPVGHLRIAEAVPPKDGAAPRFPIREVVDRAQGFLAYAAERGAAIGGATGAGGEAPKLLLRLDGEDRVWIDTWQDEPGSPDRHYLVKFPRHAGRRIDATILRCEYAYYHALAELDVEGIRTDGMRLIEGENGPSLWLPRFDVARDAAGRERRHAVESYYALIDAPPGSWQSHATYLAALRAVLADEPGHDPQALAGEYLRRDLLNLVFGNTDNHGRNAALLRTVDGMRLAPIYDFAPMALDPDGIIRTTRWDRHERAGVVDWTAVTEALADDGDPAALRESLRDLAERLRDLPARLARLGMPAEALASPRLGLARTEEKLRAWGLLR